MKHKHSNTLEQVSQARERAKERLIADGLTVTAWALKHQLNPATVYQVLSGRSKGLVGEGHRAAVLLGIKRPARGAIARGAK